ncbi:MAG: hypothetical protein R3F04_16360 [Lysobacteraceae bacterium]
MAEAFTFGITVEMRFGVEKIGIDQTRKQHPHIEHCGNHQMPVREKRDFRTSEHQTILRRAQLQSFKIAVGKRKTAHRAIRKIGGDEVAKAFHVAALQSKMVAQDRQRSRNGLEFRQGERRALRPVIKARLLPAKAGLKTIRKLAQVVKQTCECGLVSP